MSDESRGTALGGVAEEVFVHLHKGAAECVGDGRGGGASGSGGRPSDSGSGEAIARISRVAVLRRQRLLEQARQHGGRQRCSDVAVASMAVTHRKHARRRLTRERILHRGPGTLVRRATKVGSRHLNAILRGCGSKCHRSGVATTARSGARSGATIEERLAAKSEAEGLQQ